MAGSARGSPRDNQPPEYLVVGKVVSSFGVAGEVKVALDTDFPELVLKAARLYLGDPPARYAVERARMHKGMAVLKLAGCDRHEEAEGLRGQLVQVRREEAPLPKEGEFYYYQLLGLEVWTEEGELLGRVADIWPTGSNEVLLVQGAQGEILLPAIEPVIRQVDLEAGRIRVHLLEGLR